MDIFKRKHRLTSRLLSLLVISTVICFTLLLFREYFSKEHESTENISKNQKIPVEQFNISEVRYGIGKPLRPHFTIAKKDVYEYLAVYDNSNNINYTTCPFSIVNGARPVPYYPAKHLNWPEVSRLFANLMRVSAGGEWQPDDCASQFLVAIIIPVQNRESNLRDFLLHIHPFLQRQHIHYRIYVIELPSNITWNKGVLFNAGFIEAMKDKSFPCLILHDVDTLPTHRNHIYACTTGPRFMVVSRSPPHEVQPYAFPGGAVAILSDHFKLINGFSNRFVNWGGEDVAYYIRLRKLELPIMRFEPDISCYQSLPHIRATRPSKNRYHLLAEELHQRGDGLNTTKYNLISRVNEPLCTRIIVRPNL